MDSGSNVTGDAKNANARANIGLAAGSEHSKAQASAGAFAAGQANTGAFQVGKANNTGHPVTTGAYGNLSANGHGLSVEHARAPGQNVSNTVSANANLFKNEQQSLQANAFHTRVQPNQGAPFEKFGGGLNMQGPGGGASVGVTHLPKHNMTMMQASGQTNLWTSKNGTGTLDANANISRHMSGPFSGQQNIGGGFVFRQGF